MATKEMNNNDNDTEDPFSCFGGDDDDDDDDNDDDDEVNDTHQEQQQQRSNENGILSFHPGTEQALLVHVRNTAERGNPSSVLAAMDAFCTERHWMMHVGPTKGRILTDFLQQCHHHHHHPVNATGDTVPSDHSLSMVVLEPGTYCAYSTVLMAHILRGQTQHSTTTRPSFHDSFHIYTVEAYPAFAAVARSILQHAGLQDCVTVLERDLNAPYRERPHGGPDNPSSLSSLLHKAGISRETPGGADFVFIDHDKSAYRADLVELEQTGIVRKGTHVAADNVIFANIQDYIDYMRQRSVQGIVETTVKESVLEYSDAWATTLVQTTEPSSTAFSVKDGIELSVYLKDPV